MIKYSQFFPDKYVEGDYEIVGNVFDYPLNNKGRFDISLCESCLWLSVWTREGNCFVWWAVLQLR